MKIKAILKGNEIKFTQLVVLKRPEVEVEVDLPDEEVKIYPEEEIEKMSLDGLAHLIWCENQLTKAQIAHLNKDYKELVRESLEDRYK
jgi:hypothetical protein